MSLFSETLAQYISKSNLPVRTIAHNANVNRTSIQHALAGKRVLSQEAILRISDALWLSLDEKRQLLEYSKLERIGKKKYYSRKHVKMLLERVSDLSKINPIVQAHTQASARLKKPIESGFYENIYEVTALLVRILPEIVSSNAQMHLYLPFEFELFFSLLKEIYLEKKGDVSIRHLVELDNTTEHYKYNFTCLENVLPFAFSVYGGYQARYLFKPVVANALSPVVLPYYLSTDDFVVSFSKDFVTACVEIDPVRVAHYRNSFAEIYDQCAAFSTNMVTDIHAITKSIKLLQTMKDTLYCLEAQPCFATFFTAEMIEEHLKNQVPHREAIKQQLLALYSSDQDPSKQMHSIFTVEGIKQFAQTGVCINFPTEYATSFSKKERVFLLQCVQDAIAQDSPYFHIIDPKEFQFFPQYSVSCSENQGVLFLKVTNDYVYTSFLENHLFRSTFCDFAQYLIESELVYTKQAAMDVLCFYIEQCKK